MENFQIVAGRLTRLGRLGEAETMANEYDDDTRNNKRPYQYYRSYPKLRVSIE